MLKSIIVIGSFILAPPVFVLATEPPPILEQHKDIADKNIAPLAAPPLPTIQPADPAHRNAVVLEPRKLSNIAPEKIYISEKNAPLGKKSAKAVRLARKWMDKPILPAMEGKDGSVVYTFGETMPILVCRPLRVCALQLEMGEKIIDPPQCGDTSQWKISPSRPNELRPPHIYIKPLDSGLTTDLIIVTNRRTYVVALKSRNDSYTPLVSFRYPENEKQAWTKALAEQERLEAERNHNRRFSAGGIRFNAEDLDFNYTVKGDATWKPLRVFNYRAKTYLEMPEIMKMYEAPVLLTVNDGQEALVNYRLHDELFIVDQLFNSAILISGVGNHQTKITIARDTAKITNHEDTEDEDN